MGVVIPASFAQATWYGFHGAVGQNWACTMGLDITGGADATALADACWDAWSGQVMVVQTASTALQGCRVKVGPNDFGPVGEHVETAVGSLDNPTSPSNVAVLVRKITAAGGRANRGRMYIPGISEGLVANTGQIDGLHRSTWQDVIDDFRGELVASLLIDGLVVLHDESSPVSTPTPITALTVDPLIATQRRRLRR